MGPSIITALAALTGAAIGGLTSVVASLLAQRKQAHARWITQERLRRQELYKEFIEDASKSHIDALQHNEGDIPALVVLYSKIARIRILSSPKVICSAEQIGTKILDTYLQPNKTFLELREMVSNHSIDIFRDFSEACREELESLRV